MQFNAACIQLTSGSDVQANMAMVKERVRTAAEAGAEFIATPETTFLIEGDGGRETYTSDNHPAIPFSSNLAKEMGTWLLIGSLLLLDEERGKRWNRSLLFNPAGELVAQYDKIHLFHVELPDRGAYLEGDRVLAGDKAVLADSPWGKLGMSVCYDIRFPHLYRTLAQAGAIFLAIPAAFTAYTGKAHWEPLLKARAIENGCYVFAPAQVGEHPGKRVTHGHSMIIDPWGEIIAEAADDDPFIIAKIDTEKVTEARTKIPSLEYDRDILLPLSSPIAR
jgi:predicted amidohydrolase